MRALLLRRSLLAYLSLAGCVGDIAGPSAEPPSADVHAVPCANGRARPLADGLRIREIALYQTVKVPLYRDGTWLTERRAPIVRGKRALLRVFVEPLEGYAPHEVAAVLRLEHAGQARALSDARTLTAASSDAKLASTFNIDIPADVIAANPGLSVSLEEPSCAAPAGAREDARVPAEGSKGLDVEDVGKLRITLVPLVVAGRTPPVTLETVEALRASLLAYYPIPDVAVTLHPPVAAADAAPVGSGPWWDQLVAQMKALRRSAQPNADEYFVGVHQPADSYEAFCKGRCVVGLAPHIKRRDAKEQVAVAAFFGVPRSYETIIHELGHAHGLAHAPAPCGAPTGIDPAFPYPDGNTGSWGWDRRSDELTAPSRHDVMGYCESANWISPYHYRALAARAQGVNARSGAMRAGVAGRARELLLTADGSARWASAALLDEPGGDPEPATVFDTAGNEIARIELGVVALSHSASKFVYVPELGPTWATIVWSGGELRLAEILPPYGS